MTTEMEKTDLVTLTIDEIEVSVPKGTLVIRAAEQVGVQIPRFCDHPLLAPVGACRQCLVEIALPDRDGNPKTMMGPPGRVKPQASCTMVCSDGMVVNTQTSSKIADKAQQGVMEALLINHPLDCPVCDKGGECPLQNQAMSNGRAESRFHDSGGAKRTFPKPLHISAQVLLDRERCVLCARCTRFSEQIAGDPFIALIERGALQQVGIYEHEPFESYFSGNTIQICPVGALTSASYRFRSRPFDLVSTPGVGEHDSGGAAIRVDHRRGKVMRRLSGNDPEVNEEWITDKDRFAFGYASLPDRLTHPLVRDAETAELRPASWPEALAVAARGLAAADGVGVLPGGRLTAEDAYAYAKFARVALGTNDVDFRARRHSGEEAAFLAAHVAGTPETVTYGSLERATAVLLVGLEPEDEAGNLFLRLRKASRDGLRVWSVAPFTSRGLAKMNGVLVRTAPGQEPEALDALASDGELALDAGGVVLVGERAADSPGTLTAVASLAATTGARVAWVPRRAGDRGALDAGCLPGLLPGARPVADPAARVDLGAVWGTTVPTTPGRDTAGILAAAASGELGALLVGGVDPVDLPDPAAALAAVRAAGFVVSLELRESAVTELADVVLPVASVTEKSGGFVNWEGRYRGFTKVMGGSHALSDARVLAGIADELGVDLGFRTVEQVQDELGEVGVWDGARPTFEPGPADETVRDTATGPADGPVGGAEDGLRLATWKLMIGDGRMQDGSDHLRETARAPVALVSPATLERLGLVTGQVVRLTAGHGSHTLPVAVADLPEGVVWTPTTAAWSAVPGDVVRLDTTDGDAA